MTRNPEVRAAALDRLLETAVADGVAPGIVAGVTNADGVVYNGAFGLAQTHAARAMRRATVFRIASMTKLVTTIAIMQLHELGSIDLEAPFAKCFPEFRQPEVLTSFDPATHRFTTRPARAQVTVRQLLTHTAGFGYWFLSPELYALMDGPVEYFNPPFLLHEPGTRFTYGIGTDVLGQAIPSVTGEPFEAFVVRRVLSPLGMSSTSFALPQGHRLAAVQAASATGFEEIANETSVTEAPHGGGGMYSTADDYLALLRMLLNDGAIGAAAVLSARSVRAMTRNQIGALVAERQTTAVRARTDDFLFMDGTQKFGFGVLIETRDRPTGRSAGSYGWGGIYNTYYWVDPAARLGAVLLMQVSPFSRPACLGLCDRFEATVLGRR